jgi:putative phage-type endonuclease
MKFVDVEQGTEEWLKWRKTLITATDCPVIMGSSPWSTPYKCWQNKLGLLGDQAPNAAMQRGKELEPLAREWFSKTICEMNPKVIESSEYSFIGASLDGISNLGNHILEIKCGSEKLHALAKDGIIPEYYKDQIQHQLLVTRAGSCFYVSFDGIDGIIIRVEPDPTFAERFLKKARDFWKCVANAEPPAMSQKDYKDMTLEPKWELYTNMYKNIEDSIKKMETQKSLIRQTLISLCENQSCQGNGLKVINQASKGRIDYDEVKELKGIDLEKYRKPAIQSWKFLIDK